MPATITETRNALLGTFAAAWSAAAPGILGYVPPVRYAGVVEGNSPDPGAFWAMVGVQHVTGAPASVGYGRFEHAGLLTVDVYGIQEDQGLEKVDQLVQALVDAFEGKDAGDGTNVWFRDVRVREVAPERAWHRVQVIAEWVAFYTKVAGP